MIALNIWVAVIDAFHAPYIGAGYQILLSAIDSMTASAFNYANLLPVVQSSGMGKSKAVHEIGNHRVVISMCLREDDLEGSMCEHLLVYYGIKALMRRTAYPPTNSQVRDFLMAGPPPGDVDGCKAHIRRFLVSLFQHANTTLEATKRDFSDNDRYAEAVRFFHNLFDSNVECTNFFDGVVSLCKENISSPIPPDLVAACRTLTSNLDPNDQQPRFKVVLGFDEVHILHGNLPANQHSRFSRLKSVLAELNKCYVCAVALTTATSLSKLAPAKSIAPSERERALDTHVPAPFTALPFDAYVVYSPLKPGKYTLESVGTLAFTVIFGRPLSVSSAFIFV